MFLNVLKIVAAVATVATGVVSMFWPTSVYGFTGLQVSGPRGITEIRAVLGAFFVALGAMALIYHSPETYRMLGVTYVVVGLTRGVSMFVDGSVMRSNIISLIVEVVLGIILVI
jgi:hypothetical protein